MLVIDERISRCVQLRLPIIGGVISIITLATAYVLLSTATLAKIVLPVANGVSPSVREGTSTVVRLRNITDRHASKQCTICRILHAIE